VRAGMVDVSCVMGNPLSGQSQPEVSKPQAEV
jgi:hypothetical protein